MKSKLKNEINAGFDEMGVRPYVYHIREYRSGNHQRRLRMFEGITIASDKRQDVIALEQAVGDLDQAFCSGAAPATWMRRELAIIGFNGVAICDHRDQFSRKRGWLIACGRLLKYLRRCNRA
jgi:hypothetical protein